MKIIFLIVALLSLVIKTFGASEFKNKLGETVSYLYRNCENQIYYSDNQIGLENIEVIGGTLKGKIGENGFKIIPFESTTKIVILNDLGNDTLIFKTRSLPLPKFQINGNNTNKDPDSYSISKGVSINLIIDSSFIALCPNEFLYVIEFKLNLLNYKTKDYLNADTIIISSGENRIILEDWIIEELKSRKYNAISLEPSFFVRKNGASEFHSLCSISLFRNLKVVD
jgi:hypothetical protein